jgi:hypothetical protein
MFVFHVSVVDLTKAKGLHVFFLALKVFPNLGIFSWGLEYFHGAGKFSSL